ncbi:MAG: DUF3857 domain-containing protein [Cyclobacteriaceae bacterium]
MKTKILIYTLLLLTFSGFSQTTDAPGGIENSVVAATEIDQFPDAEAVVLFDKGVSQFYENEGFKISFTRTRRIKILKKSGYKWADIVIPFYSDGYGKTEVIKNIKAYTYNYEDGSVVTTPVNPESIYREKINDYWNKMVFALPQVKEGSVIEYQYELETPFLFNLPDWEFQSRIPTLISEYEVGILPYYEYVYIAQGMKGFAKFNQFDRRFSSQNIGYSAVEIRENVFQFGMENIPAFESEDYITSIDDYIMKIDFQLSKINFIQGGSREIMSNFSDISTAFIEHDSYGKFLKKSGKKAAEQVEGMNLAGKTDAEKIKKIVGHMKESYNWNGQNRRYTSQSVKEFINNKKGNSSELNLFLTAMLRAAEMESHPVLLSTRSNGKIRGDYPFESSFNYTLSLVTTENGNILLDATDSFLKFDRIPSNCINEKGLIVRKNSEEWIDLRSDVISTESYFYDLEFKPDEGSLSGSYEIKSTEYHGRINRSGIGNNVEGIANYFDSKAGEINNVVTENYADIDSPFIIRFEGKSEVEKIGNQYYILPFGNFPVKENPLKAKDRSYPVDMVFKSHKEFVSSIEIPEGYKVTDYFKPYTLENELIEIRYSVNVEDKKIVSRGSYVFKKDIYQPSEYSRLKYYFNEIVKLNTSPITLEKSN